MTKNVYRLVFLGMYITRSNAFSMASTVEYFKSTNLGYYYKVMYNETLISRGIFTDKGVSHDTL